MTEAPRHIETPSPPDDGARDAAAAQLRAKRWVVILTAALIAVPVGVTVEQLATHGATFFVCRGPAVGATSHRAADCPRP